MASDFQATAKSKVRRSANRAAYDRESVYDIIDRCRICHVSFVEGGTPVIIPTIHARMDDRLIFHGAKASRMMQQIASGAEVCVAFTLLDGLVLARSAFHHSMNYRSVVLFGRGEEVEDAKEKAQALDCLVDSVLPGRAADARPANAKELRATLVAALHIESASAKIRSGPPKDETEDMELPIWAGVVPLFESVGRAIPDAPAGKSLPEPDYLQAAERR